MTLTQLRQVETEMDSTRCFFCGLLLGNKRCAANTPVGPRWFCKQEPRSNPLESCYQDWKTRQPRSANSAGRAPS
jgi:hypothetical protein